MQYGGLTEDRENDKESVMRNTIVGRILMYLSVWVVLFLILCVLSIIKNWSVLVAILSSTIYTLIELIFVIGLMLYGIIMMIRALFR